ncbi:MAG TPA: hypothetical protein VGH88_19260 [Streptosporangiaceae bacterium]|jgi:hypothetical protein
MSRWTDRILAALGLGGRKPEADVSYDPAEPARSAARTAASDEGTAVQVPDQQAARRDGAAGAGPAPGGH